MNHKCDGCKYKGEHQEMMFKPFGVCCRISDLAEAEKAYKADICPFSDKYASFDAALQKCTVVTETLRECLERVRERATQYVNTLQDSFSHAYVQYAEALNEINEIFEAENRLASVSSFDFVYAFRYIAKQIAEGRIEPYKETYLLLCHEACEMLCSGVEQSDVLWHFEKQLYPKKEVQHNEMSNTAKTNDTE